MFTKIKTKYVGKKISSYTIDTLIGQGRYGICFLAHSDDNQKVVLKKFKTKMFIKNAKKNEFEAVILSQLQDKRIPQLLGVINEKGFYGFVLEFKYGLTIKELLFKKHHKFSDKEIYEIGSKLIGIIKYLHHNGVVHRDIRIPNVLYDHGDVTLVDFGLARWSNNQYPFDMDYSYLGDFLLYLFYSTFESTKRSKKKPWYVELDLTDDQKQFLKKLLRLEPTYDSIDDVEAIFLKLFKC